MLTQADRVGRRRGRRRKRRRRLVAAALMVFALAPITYSYVTTMLKPSSLPLTIRTVEWVRTNHGAWLVNTVERVWYSWHAPKPGGPALRALPRVGLRAAKARKRLVDVPLRLGWRPSLIRSLIVPRLRGEGAWRAAGKSVRGRPPVLVTTFRSEPSYPRIVAYVAWIDHTRTQLALYPGRYEPPNAAPRGPLEVPPGERARLLATFNSGFTYRDGHGGFSVNGLTATPLRRGEGTVVAYRSGRVDIVSWKGSASPGRTVILARQNLPLIVDHATPNSRLGDGSLWGDTLGNAIRVWRSGIGIDRRGNLIYAAANDQTAATLAAILIHAGAIRAIELDINAEWPSFITYGRSGGVDPAKLVPNSQQPATRYLTADDRDFFAVYRRSSGAAYVPFG